MIRILTKKFQEALVDEQHLDNLIVSKRLIAFNRSDRWAVVGKDAVREQHTFYRGAERRRTVYGVGFQMR